MGSKRTKSGEAFFVEKQCCSVKIEKRVVSFGPAFEDGYDTKQFRYT
jgi:hypothetical protein